MNSFAARAQFNVLNWYTLILVCRREINKVLYNLYLYSRVRADKIKTLQRRIICETKLCVVATHIVWYRIANVKSAVTVAFACV